MRVEGRWVLQDKEKIKAVIESGDTYLGLELGSTRIKAVLIDSNHQPVASGSHKWENTLVDGMWTYSLEEVWHGLRDCYTKLVNDVRERYSAALSNLGAIGFSGMMHGYMAFDNNNLLVPFRTWRNTNTGQASAMLTNLFRFNIPQRWSIAHLYQAMLNGEVHVPQITYLTTLAGYIHWQLTGQKVLGIGDASGMFPIDITTGQFDARMLAQFNDLIAEKNYPWKVGDILPRVLTAGNDAGALTAAGALLLDPSGTLKPGIPLCPPEGDAGTGMAATNSVTCRTGNISAGTSVFVMIVLEKALRDVYPEIDMVTTPTGDPVAMVHCNNCTSDIDAWIELFAEAAEALGARPDKDVLYHILYKKALEGDADCGALLSYNYIAGEPVTGFNEGRPLFVRLPGAKLSLPNVMRTHLYAALGTLKLGMDILLEGENVHMTSVMGHGGYFKVQGVGQKIMAAALDTPVTVMDTAGEGGPWGMAILAAYMANKELDETLESYLKNKVFMGAVSSTVAPAPEDVAGFRAFMEKYKKGLAAERAAVEML